MRRGPEQGLGLLRECLLLAAAALRRLREGWAPRQLGVE